MVALILVILLPIAVNLDIIATHKLIPASDVHGDGHFHGDSGNRHNTKISEDSFLDHHHPAKETSHSTDAESALLVTQSHSEINKHHHTATGNATRTEIKQEDEEMRKHYHDDDETTSISNISHVEESRERDDNHRADSHIENNHHFEGLDPEANERSGHEHPAHHNEDHSEDKIEKPEQMVCQYDNVAANHYFYSYVKTPVDITIYCFVPFVILMITNCLIIYTVVRAKTFRENQNSTKEKENKQDDDISKMIGMLLSTCLMFIVTTLPSGIYLSLPSVPHEVSIAFQKEKFSFHSMFLIFCSIHQYQIKHKKIRLFCRRNSVQTMFFVEVFRLCYLLIMQLTSIST